MQQTATLTAKPVSVPDVPPLRKQKNLVRRQSDYGWIFLLFVLLWIAGEHFHKQRTSADELEQMHAAFNFVGWSSYLAQYASFFLLTGVSLVGLTAGMWWIMKKLKPETPEVVLSEQLQTIVVNLCLVLPTYQCIWEAVVLSGSTKVTMGRLDIASCLQDACTWMLVFELAWYVQHRAMHDNKLLWRWGHEYHHQWKRPEHMIGITNFAFDAIVEGWVTMSSSFVPVLLFPINWHVRAVLGLLYMLLAVLVHWDFFPVRYHLNHHYYVTKNYGSHIPIFDMLFGTYQGDYWVPSAWQGRAAAAKAD